MADELASAWRQWTPGSQFTHSKRYDAYRLEDTRTHEREDMRRRTFQTRVDGNSTENDRSDDDQHRDECCLSTTVEKMKGGTACARPKAKDSPNEDDFDSFAISRCKLRGNDTVMVMRTMMKCRSTSQRRTECSARPGKIYAMT